MGTRENRVCKGLNPITLFMTADSVANYDILSFATSSFPELARVESRLERSVNHSLLVAEP